MWPTHDSRVVYENPWIRVREDDVTRPDGSRGIYGVVETHAPSVFIVALDEADRVVLVTQDRHTTGGPSVEVPAGGSDGDDLLEAARRELWEETGLTAGRWTRIGSLAAMNGISSEIQHVFLARDLEASGEDRRAEDGITDVRRVPFGDALELVRRGEIADGQTVSSLMLAALELGLL